MEFAKVTVSDEEFEKRCKYTPVTLEDGTDFMKRFFNPVKPLIYVTARRKEGKTAMMLNIAENYHHERPEDCIYVYGFPNWKDLPEYFIPITEDNLDPESPNCISVGGLLLVDEAGLKAYDFKKLLNRMLVVTGHFDLGMLYAGQSLKQITPTTLELIDGFIMKRPTDSQLGGFHRREFRDQMKVLRDNVDRFNDKSLFYYCGLGFDGLFGHSELPSFWDVKMSKGYNQNA